MQQSLAVSYWTLACLTILFRDHINVLHTWGTDVWSVNDQLSSEMDIASFSIGFVRGYRTSHRCWLLSLLDSADPLCDLCGKRCALPYEPYNMTVTGSWEQTSIQTVTAIAVRFCPKKLLGHPLLVCFLLLIVEVSNIVVAAQIFQSGTTGERRCDMPQEFRRLTGYRKCTCFPVIMACGVTCLSLHMYLSCCSDNDELGYKHVLIPSFWACMTRPWPAEQIETYAYMWLYNARMKLIEQEVLYYHSSSHKDVKLWQLDLCCWLSQSVKALAIRDRWSSFSWVGEVTLEIFAVTQTHLT